MKNVLILMAFVISFTAYGQEIELAAKALSDGNVETLTSLFDETVEVCIEDDLDLLDKKEAKAKIEGFFKVNTPKSFTRKHKGDSKGKDSQYVIGDLTTSTSNYRVYLYFGNVKGKKKIQEIRLDKL